MYDVKTLFGQKTVTEYKFSEWDFPVENDLTPCGVILNLLRCLKSEKFKTNTFYRYSQPKLDRRLAEGGIPREKAKSAEPKREKGKPLDTEFHPDLTRHTHRARTHKRNEMISRLGRCAPPPTSD